MECYIPLDKSVPNNDVQSLKESHGLRRFVIFDEDLKIVLRSSNLIETFTVWINDAKVHEGSISDSFEDVYKDRSTWELKTDLCARNLFRSSVVMNNGYNNQIKFVFEYLEHTASSENSPLNGKFKVEHEAETDDEEFLPSFEPVSGINSITKQTEQLHLRSNSSAISNAPKKTVELVYPIYSLLNMRLRNSLLKSRHFIISSLDFQTSKASVQLSEKFLSGDKDVHSFRLEFDQIVYELVDKKSSIPLDPIYPFELPLNCVAYDGVSFSYKLPLIPGATTSAALHRVKITLGYTLVIDKLQQKLPIITTWETDVTLKKPLSNATISQTSSVISTPRLYGISPRINMLNSTSSFVNNKSNNVKFKFVKNRITVTKGEKFTLKLQIFNSSSSSLEMVVYYNNKIPSPSQSSSTVPLDKQYQVYRRYRKITEGIILLSNDYKIPTVEPNETYLVDLNFIGIMSGYYATLSGLKMIDLKTNEVIEIGQSASVFVK